MIHHLNCASFRMRGVGPMVAHCLLVERPGGLLLVDTGLGTDDIADPQRLGAAWRALSRPRLSLAETAVAQVRALGHDPADVSDIVLTHLDVDHAGGVGDFPGATVHVHAAELGAARRPRLSERGRYVPGQWADADIHVFTGGNDQWFGFGGVHPLGDDVVLVPLPGHTRGHQGVAVARPGGGWLLHAGDAYFSAGDDPRALRAMQSVVAHDRSWMRTNQERLAELRARHGDEVTVFCSHDADELAALQDGSG